MAKSRYADNLCCGCGRKITIYRPKHDAEKRDQDKATLWEEMQRRGAVRCKRCARRVAISEMHRLSGLLVGVAD